MTDDVTQTEEPYYEDAIASRGEVILHMCLNVNRVEDEQAKDALLKAVERITLSIQTVEPKTSRVTALKGGKTEL